MSNLKTLEMNVGAIETEIKSLCYYSQGAVTYENALYMSPKDRNDWIKFINEIQADRQNKFKQEEIIDD